ncbi:MAG: transposase [Thiotrichaceae bacterium]|nr:transposase [Thiotrichaceae bacterium]
MKYYTSREASKILDVHVNTFAVCLAQNNETTLQDKWILCEKNIPTQKSSKTLEAVSTSNGKNLKPFWNEQCAAMASNLWLPTETDWLDSDKTLSNKLSSLMVENSWFSTKLLVRPNKNLPKTCSISYTSLVTECTDLEITKSKLHKLHLTAQNKMHFNKWLRVSRFVYNTTIALLRDYEGDKKPSWMDIKKMFTRLLPEWTKDTPFQVKGMAIKDAHNAFWKTCKTNKGRGKPTTFRFRSRKDPVQSCFIPKSAISLNGIYPQISGKGLGYTESLPESCLDSRLVWKAGKFYLAVPAKYRVPSGDNQAHGVVAIDPGVRTFATFYSTESCGLLGHSDFSRIQRMAHYLDDLVSRASKAGKQKKKCMMLAGLRMRQKVQNLIDELHHKTALFLVKNFDCILLPTFETSQMVGRSGRKIRCKTVRNMLTFAHYRFKQFLKNKASEHGKTVVDVCEAYTSKTHPETGEIKQTGGAKRIRLLSGEWVNRDIVGARNILLRALVDKPDCFTVAVGIS